MKVIMLRIIGCHILLRLRKTHNSLQLPVSFFSFFSFSFFCVIRNIGKFGAKNYFTDHRTANTIQGFTDSVPVLKIHDCYQDKQKFEQHSIPIQVIVRLMIYPMSGNNATLKIHFTDPRKRNFVRIFFIYWIENNTPAMNKSLTYQFK